MFSRLIFSSLFAIIASLNIFASDADAPASASPAGDSALPRDSRASDAASASATPAGIRIPRIDGVRYVSPEALRALGLPTRDGIARILNASDEGKVAIARFASVELRDGETAYVVASRSDEGSGLPALDAGSPPAEALKTATITLRNIETGDPVGGFIPVDIPLKDGRRIEEITSLGAGFVLVTTAKKVASETDKDEEAEWSSTQAEVYVADTRSGRVSPVKLDGHKFNSVQVSHHKRSADGSALVYLSFDNLEREPATHADPSAEGSSGAASGRGPAQVAAEEDTSLGLIRLSSELGASLRRVSAKKGKTANVLLRVVFAPTPGVADEARGGGEGPRRVDAASASAMGGASATEESLFQDPHVFGFSAPGESVGWHFEGEEPLASISRTGASPWNITGAIRSRAVGGAWEPAPRSFPLRSKHEPGNVFRDPFTRKLMVTSCGQFAPGSPTIPYLLDLASGEETRLMSEADASRLRGEIADSWALPVAPSTFLLLTETDSDVRSTQLRLVSTDPSRPIDDRAQERLATWAAPIFGDPAGGETRIISSALGIESTLLPDASLALRAFAGRFFASVPDAGAAGDGAERTDGTAASRSAAEPGPLDALTFLQLRRSDIGEQVNVVDMTGTTRPAHPSIFRTVPGMETSREVLWYRSRISPEGISDPTRFEVLASPATDDNLYFRLFVTNPPVTVVPAGSTPATVFLDYGGPEAHNRRYHDVFAQVVASRGFRVVTVDHVGSTSYGQAAIDALHDNWADAAEEFSDIVRRLTPPGGTAHTIGCSYGGYLVAKAAVGATITIVNGEINLETADRLTAGGFQPDSTGFEGLAYWRRHYGASSETPEGCELLREMSPPTDATIPTLVFVGTEDKSVHPFAGRQYAAARHRDGANIRLVELPGAGHRFDDGSSDQALAQIDLMLAHIAGHVTPTERAFLQFEEPAAEPFGPAVAMEIDLRAAVFRPPYPEPEAGGAAGASPPLPALPAVAAAPALADDLEARAGPSAAGDRAPTADREE